MVENEPLTIKRIDTTDSKIYCMTKNIGRAFFYRHTDCLMGKINPDYVSNNKYIILYYINMFYTSIYV